MVTLGDEDCLLPKNRALNSSLISPRIYFSAINAERYILRQNLAFEEPTVEIMTTSSLLARVTFYHRPYCHPRGISLAVCQLV